MQRAPPYRLCLTDTKEDRTCMASRLVRRVTSLLHGKLADNPSTQHPKYCAGKTGPHITLLVDVPNLSWSIATALCSRPCSMSSSSVTVTRNRHVWPIGSSIRGDRHSKDCSAHRRLKRGICPMTHVGILSKETQKPWPFFSVCWFGDILSSLK